MTMKKSYAITSVIFVILFPLVIIGHELSHYVVARWLGYVPHFAYDRNEITAGPSLLEDLPWISASAPVYHLTIGFVGAWLLWRLRNALQRPVVTSIATALCLAGCYHLPHLIGFVIKPLKTGHIDEHKVALGLGLAPWSLHFLIWPIALFFLAWVLWFHRRQGTLLTLLVGFIAGIASIGLYFFILGPLLLPHRAT